MPKHQKAPRWNGERSARNAVCSFPERRFDESFPVELSGKEQEERRKRNRGTRKRRDPHARPAERSGVRGLELGLRLGEGGGKLEPACEPHPLRPQICLDGLVG